MTTELETYSKVGDDVMVNPGDDEDMIRARNADTDAAQSTNSYANRLWYSISSFLNLGLSESVQVLSHLSFL